MTAFCSHCGTGAPVAFVGLGLDFVVVVAHTRAAGVADRNFDPRTWAATPRLPCTDGAWYRTTEAEREANLERFLESLPVRYCVGVFDDGIADGNVTECSMTHGCGLTGCRLRDSEPRTAP